MSPFLFADFNIDRPYLKDVRVRRALAQAIDLSALAKVVWYGFAIPATSPVPSTLPEFHDPAVPKYSLDLKRAEALLDEAGFKRGSDGNRFSLSLDYIPYGDDFKRTGEFIKASLKRVGIEVNVRGQDTAAYTRRLYGDRDFDIAITWFAAFSDPQVGVTRAYWSQSVGKNIPWTNASGYRNPAIDKIIAEVQGEPDGAKRVELFKRFQRTVMEDLPTLPLLELRFFTVEASNLRHPITGDQVYGSFRDFTIEPRSN